jgi:predicted metal-dependent hydrolase
MLNKFLRLPASPPAAEQRSIQLADRLVSYTLKRSPRRRSIGLQINDNGLTVSMPLRASEKWLHSVLQEKAGWVVDKLENWQRRKTTVQKWADGEQIMFRGETFTLRAINSRFNVPPQLTLGELVIHVLDSSNPAAVKKTILQWYKQEAMRVFGECVEHFAPLMGVAPRELKLTSARTQWGNCNAQGVVRLNWQLVTMPLPLIDYVVVHELAHLQEMNHSPAFWRVVEKACPDYGQIRRELRNWNPAVDDEI